MTLWLVLAGLLLLALGTVATYNGLVRSSNRVREAWSGVDVQLTRRADLVPNLVEAVRGYAAHERGVLEEVVRARAAVVQSRNPRSAAHADAILSQALARLFVVVEQYPELRASQHFGRLQAELSELEQKIAFARQFYNRNVLFYNTRTGRFPALGIARLLGFEPAPFFEAEAGARDAVSVSVGRAAPAGETSGPSGTSPST